MDGFGPTPGASKRKATEEKFLLIFHCLSLNIFKMEIAWVWLIREPIYNFCCNLLPLLQFSDPNNLGLP
ncbi:hypothetical protein BamMEX5DRAFT_4363 [Burkholderia ambifaria MEX-5]|uniref:Uncharacterized protein n=1 Tax=Burkholderia ambifaria MEX-5 TaxID=396597 RepID=B1T997_9BURK|nr:hypothetical protein BamMEX5DRAFT_4363 [Burkholderia ambifaria MEX-5]